jgi:hypothetical protein
VPDTLDDAELLKRLDTAIADGGRLLAELGRLRDAVAARTAEPEILAAADDDDTNQALIDTTSAAARFGYASDSIRKMCREVDGIGCLERLALAGASWGTAAAPRAKK